MFIVGNTVYNIDYDIIFIVLKSWKSQKVLFFILESRDNINTVSYPYNIQASVFKNMNIFIFWKRKITN